MPPAISKTVLITGCSPGGLGHAMAEEFRAKGCRVFASARSSKVVAQLQELGYEALTIDVTSEKSIASARESILVWTGGSLDILVNNAGLSHLDPLLDIDVDRFRLLFEVNVLALHSVTKAFLPMLIDAHGLVVNVSSAADRIPFPFRGAYGMTKAAVSSFSRTLEVELYHFNVRVLNVVSTMVKSNLAQNASARLPPDSLWSNMAEHMDPVPEDTKMESKDWAQKTVFEALRGEGYHVGPFRLSGTKSEFWVGSNSGPTRALWCLGSGWLRWVALILWPLGRVKSPEK